MAAPRRDWSTILTEAKDIVDSYDTPVTLRQLFYRLVVRALLTNDRSAYSTLSDLTAKARRAEEFPRLLDMTRSITKTPSWDGPDQFVESVIKQYARDHTEGQEVRLVLGAEKNTLLAQFTNWFRMYHLPTVITRGYGSQTYKDDVRDANEADGRPAVLLYVGDFDCSGEDITRDFVRRTGPWKHVERVGLNADQVLSMGLPIGRGKPQDPRANKFRDKYAHLFGHMFAGEYMTTKSGVVLPQQGIVQVEVEAIDPTDLRTMVGASIANWWDQDAYLSTLVQESQDRKELQRRWS